MVYNTVLICSTIASNNSFSAISKYGDYEWFVSDDPYIAKEKPLPDFMNIPDGYEEEIPFA